MYDFISSFFHFLAMTTPHVRTLFTSVLAGILLSITPIAWLSPFANAADTGTVIVEQKNTVYKGTKRLGSWGLSMPIGVINGETETFTTKDKPVGNYALTVTPPAGALSTIEVYEDGTLKETFDSRTANGKINASGGTLTFTIYYKFVFLGNVAVVSKPTGLAFDIKKPDGETLKGTTPAVYEDVVEGTYTVYYKLPKPCLSPRPIARNLQTSEKSKGRVTFEFDSLCKNLKLDTDVKKPEKKDEEKKEKVEEVKKENPPRRRTTVAQSPVRVSLSTSSAEVAVGARARLNIAVLNRGDDDLADLTVHLNVDRTTVSNLQSGGAKLSSGTAQWTINSLKAGEKWETTVSAELSDAMQNGETVIANVVVSGDQIDSARVSQRSASVSIGAIKQLPQTGVSMFGGTGILPMDLIILLAVVSVTFFMLSIAGAKEMAGR
jgi:hypothetical protein